MFSPPELIVRFRAFDGGRIIAAAQSGVTTRPEHDDLMNTVGRLSSGHPAKFLLAHFGRSRSHSGVRKKVSSRRLRKRQEPADPSTLS